MRSTFNIRDRIGGVMVRVLTSSAVDRGYEPQSGQTKNYKVKLYSINNKIQKKNIALNK